MTKLTEIRRTVAVVGNILLTVIGRRLAVWLGLTVGTLITLISPDVKREVRDSRD